MQRGDIDFFYQATLRICGSLDIDTMLANSFEYIRTFIPANAISLSLFDIDKKVLNVISRIVDPGLSKPPKSLALTTEAFEYIKQYESHDDPKALVNYPEKHPVLKLVWQALGKPASSYIASRLEVEGQHIGMVTLMAKGNNRYSQTHLDMLNLLQGPFAIAMSNGLRHTELLRLKEILADDNRFLNRQLHHKAGDEIIGEHLGLKDVMGMVRQVAPLSSQVLLLGETGVGKEIIANAIHYSSERADGPFIKVNCGAIPESLIDSELFGHEKGAYTGAIDTKRGRFERADKGTIFLDEIGELPPQAQVRLLRVIQSKEFERVGGTKPIPVNIRIIAATHRNLEEMVRNKSFREDLWFRLNVFPITIPPLRHRTEDIPDLVNYFIERKSKEMNLRFIRKPAPGSMELLQDYSWPGNVRELENVVERALIRSVNLPPEKWLNFDMTTFEINNQEFPSLPRPMPGSLKIDDVMKHHIESVLKITNGKIQGENGAAAMLGINPSTLRKRMIKLGVPYGRKAGEYNV
ncbi:MAG: sigma 54-interacting transcriptional regulator [Proteobacteria bacterium]|nr:sigma 54-interacting transcriptional regulator [Pseudomonadota bacterium]